MSRDLVKQLPELRKRHARLKAEADKRAAEVQSFQDELYRLRAELVDLQDEARDAEADLADAENARQRMLRDLPGNVARVHEDLAAQVTGRRRAIERAKAKADELLERAAWLESRGRPGEAERLRKESETVAGGVPGLEKALEKLEQELQDAKEDLDQAEAEALGDA